MANPNTRIVIDDSRFFLIGLACFLFGFLLQYVLSLFMDLTTAAIWWTIYCFSYYPAILFVKIVINNAVGENFNWKYIPPSKYSLVGFLFKYFILAIYLAFVAFVFIILNPQSSSSEGSAWFLVCLSGSLGYLFFFLISISPRNAFITPKKDSNSKYFKNKEKNKIKKFRKVYITPRSF